MVAGLDPVRHQRHDLLWRWSLPFGVAILLAAVCGGLITVLVGICPMFRLRRAATKNLKALTSRR
jgi:uncharacterized integral membrane protein